MKDNYTRGIAFIMEGSTEKVFYRTFLEILSYKYGFEFIKLPISKDGDLLFCWKNNQEKILIRFNVVGTVTQISNSGSWFENTCVKKFKIPWKVFLCYDTDNSENDISKFYDGDWKLLREELAHADDIIDLAASADIEDVMLTDLSGVCNLLQIPVPDKIKGRKGKAKMKFLYRQAGKTYHEGDRAYDLIRHLDFEKIIQNSPVELIKLKQELT